VIAVDAWLAQARDALALGELAAAVRRSTS